MRFLLSLSLLFGDFSMLDVLFIVVGLAFLAAAMLYAVACDRL
jgi:hypothetical protein